jgi:hypothetical protein
MTLKVVIMACSKLPKQIDPKLYVKDRYMEVHTALEQQFDADCLSKHHVAMTPATVTWTVFFLIKYMWDENEKKKPNEIKSTQTNKQTNKQANVDSITLER